MGALVEHIIATSIAALRLGPTLAFAAPFTLLRTPISVRVLLAFSLAFWMIGPVGAGAALPAPGPELIAPFFSELVLGVSLALSLQVAFAAVLMAGRSIDIQAGFGLALLVDPATRSQIPLVGTFFAYAAASIFFATGGAVDLVAIWAGSLDLVPIGTIRAPEDIGPFLAYISAVFILAMGLAGLVILSLFLIDMTIAFLSRTLPQMNVLLLGFQVKTMVLLLILPLSVGLSASLFVELLRMALEATSRMY